MASENVNAPTAWQSTDQILVAVAMFAGQVPLSQQLFERGPNIDRYLAKDFGENFAATAEQQVIAGTGTGGQMLGLLSLPTAAVDGVPGASLVTWTQASPTPAGLIGQMGQAFADVGNTRLRPPSVAIMTPERFAWTATNKDSEGEPIIRPGTGLVPSNADQGEYGPIAGMPCLLSGEVPQDLGAGANQDAVIVMRTADFMWLPSDPVFEVYTDTADGASEMTVFASWHAYAAFVSARYPSAVATIQGTGMNRSALTYPA
jgi:HK97 family phage major capsid protein